MDALSGRAAKVVEGKKIRWGASPVRVQVPPPAPCNTSQSWYLFCRTGASAPLVRCLSAFCIRTNPARSDQVLDKVFHEPFGTLTTPFQGALARACNRAERTEDYPRPSGRSDHNYVQGILKQAVAAFEIKVADKARLMSDDRWVNAEALGMDTKRKENGVS